MRDRIPVDRDLFNLRRNMRLVIPLVMCGTAAGSVVDTVH